ncbi:hypothetical protein NKJ04_17580 [Mesorhizobium sp. M0618]|uniref:hypothetical protein n=1 Tax=Mesorhizobium sp. M0618 TaxID=2956972 RepID=UPI00333A7F0D
MPEQRIEMVDGRVFVSFDNWQKIYLVLPNGKRRPVTGKAADIVRLLVAHGAAD